MSFDPNVRVYLCGPITPKDGYTEIDNIAQAVNVYFRLINAGVVTFCPHLGGGFPDAFRVLYQRWLEYDNYWVCHWATHVVLLPRWETSAGSRREHAWALALDKILIVAPDELWQLDPTPTPMTMERPDLT